MGGITAPVVGSGACPAWIALVPSPHAAVSPASRGSVMSLNPLNSGAGILPSRRPRPRRSLDAPSQPVQQVDPGDQPQEPLPVEHDRNLPAIEDREQRLDRRLD